MGIYRFQVTLEHDTLLPRNAVVNTLYYDVGAPDSIEGTCDEIQDVYADHGTIFSSDLTGVVEIRVYNLVVGQPIFIKRYPAFATASTATASELAICLSYAAEDDPQKATRRRMGRLFMGPLNGAGAARPNATQRDIILDMGERFAQVGLAANTTWHLFSQRDASAHKIEVIWVDDAWDVQRRRGLAPTLREQRDVQ